MLKENYKDIQINKKNLIFYRIKEESKIAKQQNYWEVFHLMKGKTHGKSNIQFAKKLTSATLAKNIC